jgi:hypothetical protein
MHENLLAPDRRKEKTMRESYDRIITTIEREWLAEIIAGTKKSSNALDRVVSSLSRKKS